MTDRPVHIEADGTIRPLTDDEFAQWQADLAAAATSVSNDVPQFVSRRQFAVQAATQNDITQDEAIPWLAGTIPAILTSAIGKLPAAQQFPALAAMLADSFDRQSSWAPTIGAILNKTDAQLDAMWTAAAAIT